MCNVVIAFIGKKRCGKDTCAEHLARAYKFHHVKLASPLKEALHHLFGFTRWQLEHEKDVRDTFWDVTPRQALQVVGTEMFQYDIQKYFPHIGRTIFVDNLLRNISACDQDKFVISDMRFVHEYDRLKQKFGNSLFVIKIIRENKNKQNDEHASETEFENIPADDVIYNNTSVDELHDQLDNICVTKIDMAQQ